MGRTAGKLMIAAGLVGLTAVLTLVWMLTRTGQNTTWDWVELGDLIAATLGVMANALSLHRFEKRRGR